MTERTGGNPGVLTRIIRGLIDARADEVAALAWSWLYFFSVLSAYYVIRPIRDDMGVAGGVENLPWLFTGTLAGMLIANPPFAALVARLPRRKFVSISYRFFMANLVVFFILLHGTSGAQNVWVGRLFFIWTAVFNMFVVSIFWSVLTDVFTTDQGKRLFGFIGAGGTLGAVTGSALTTGLVGYLGPVNLLLVSVVLLEIAVFSVRRLALLSDSSSRASRAASSQETPIGGGVLSGISHAIRSPYFLNITLYMLLFTILTTFLYFHQAELVDRNFTDRAARTAFFAQIDLLVNSVTLLTQLFLTGRMVKVLGVPVTLTFLPALTLVGFIALGIIPSIALLMAFQVLRRAGNFAIARPTREVLFTVVSREDKYKAKAFIDTFIYRAGDQVGAWSYGLMGLVGLGIGGISVVAVVLSMVSIVNALWLGRKQELMAASPMPDMPLPLRAEARRA